MDKYRCSLHYCWLIQGATIVVSTIFSCYGMVVSLSHVPVWHDQRMGNVPPGIRLGMTIIAVLLCMNAVLIYNSDKSYSPLKLGLVLGMMVDALFTIMGVASETNSTVTVRLLLLSYFIYMALFSFYPGVESNEATIALIIKKVCTALGIAVFVAIIFMSTDWNRFEVQIRICELIGSLTILIFNLSFAADVAHLWHSRQVIKQQKTLFCFHGKLTREEAEKRLDVTRDGTFLIRESENLPGCYALSVSFEGKVQHYRVMVKDNLVSVDGEQYFENLEKFVEHYQLDNDGLVTRLCTPVGKEGVCIDAEKCITNIT
ncbi:uncharacterized protein [Dysidea avara]|uniref:uncharacterized protein isoform X2 n=1 Tax=Dysidea avara TaxID=196820 RepID=UPI00333275BD